MKLKQAASAYFRMLHWNGISAADLVDQVRAQLQEAPAIWDAIIRRVLHRFRGPRNMRFDFSEVREPILAIDKNGYAILGPIRALQVRKLAAIKEPVIDLPMPTSLRSRKA